ncbi:MAG TPA: pyruvate ferredoxin oxidoreductase, partial [bacterium]|nr:pyruvate ferredoxin oxidoreductase [bacterium]
TAPSGKVKPGKTEQRKDLFMIAAAHRPAYAAQTTIGYWTDLISKAEKAFKYVEQGPVFINILAPCHRGWRYPQENTVSISKLAADTLFWPMLEYEEGKIKITYKPRQKKPMTEWLKAQRRFDHLFTPQYQNMLEQIQKDVDDYWVYLEKLSAI